ncbi:MAG: hypothetical protein GX316_01860 [Firmicutes bacterium]|nr:hypothetical protein [Bacillota bacterium]
MGILAEQVTLSFLQKYIKAKDHSPERINTYFLKLVEEVGELAEVLIKNKRMEGQNIKGTVNEELYDVLYYVVALANLYDVDLEESFRLKEELNKVKYGR